MSVSCPQRTNKRTVLPCCVSIHTGIPLVTYKCMSWTLRTKCVTSTLQVFLVGDPIQLPATVISKRAVSFGYDVSLFKRLQTAGYPVQVLDTQYRMHPDICRFPSDQFYDGGVKTGEGVEAATKRPWHAQKVSRCVHVTTDVTHSPIALSLAHLWQISVLVLHIFLFLGCQLLP